MCIHTINGYIYTLSCRTSWHNCVRSGMPNRLAKWLLLACRTSGHTGIHSRTSGHIGMPNSWADWHTLAYRTAGKTGMPYSWADFHVEQLGRLAYTVMPNSLTYWHTLWHSEQVAIRECTPRGDQNYNL